MTGAASAAKDSARALWFKRYPATQTLAAFALALFVTCACSIDPLSVTGGDVMKVDSTASGVYYGILEVFLSFAGHYGALPLFALACLITFPFRYVFFGRRDSRRPSVVVPALILSVCMVVGASYDATSGAEAILGTPARIVESMVQLVGWYVAGHVGIYLAYEVLDWLGTHRVAFSEGRFGHLWRAVDFVLDKHPFAGPFAVLCITWLPTLIGMAPGIFMGDTGAQIRQWFNLPNGPSSYLKLIDANVFLNAHHPVLHTAIIGTCVQIGIDVFGSANQGVLLYTVIQFLVTALCEAYAVSQLRRFGTGLLTRACVLGFLVFMPLFSSYAVLITKDIYFADALLILMIEVAKLMLPRISKKSGAKRALDGTGSGKSAAVAVAGEASGVPSAADSADAEGEAVGGRFCEGAVVAFEPCPQIACAFTWRDWALMVVSSLGVAFFRNGCVVLSLLALLICSCTQLYDRRRARVDESALAPSRARVALPAAIALVTLGVYVWFSAVFMPAHAISPASRREALSIPFQMTARFVQKHDGAHSGVKNGTDDGLVTKKEREAIDRVLNYKTLGKRYNPNKSDAVKSDYNEYASQEDIDAYFAVWAEMFWKDPECYISAFVNNYYGYFYPSENDVLFYGSTTMRRCIARKGNQIAPFDFAVMEGPINKFCSQVVNIYRVAIQSIPLLSLTLCSATYVWGMAISSIYLLRARKWRSLALWLPLWCVLAVCLIGPCNGATYMRYIYPVVLIAPFTVAITLTWPRPYIRRA